MPPEASAQTPGLRRVEGVFDLAANVPTARMRAMGVCLVALIAVVDCLTGPSLSFALFYLAPVALVSACGSRLTRIVVIGVTLAGWMGAEVLGQSYSSLAITAWNTVSRLTVLATISFLVASFQQILHAERRSARYDPLSGVLNVKGFREAAEREIAGARRSTRPLALAYLDIDDFKLLNDRLGHAAGDQLIIAVGRLLADQLREADIVARVGGDEFAILLTGADEAGALTAVHRVHDALRSLAAARDWPVGTSIGLVTCQEAPASLEHLLQVADEQMYREKHGRKGGVRHVRLPATSHLDVLADSVCHDLAAAERAALPAATGR